MRRYQQVAFRTAYLVSGGASDSEDAAQEAFVKAFYALSRFRAGAPFRPWLLRIVANEARNRRRAAGRRDALAERAAGLSWREHEHGDPRPEDAALAGEQRSLLLTALRSLPEDDQIVIAYRYFLELSEAEMAHALGRPRGTIKSRLSRALGRLRGQLAEAGELARHEYRDGEGARP